MNVRLCSHRLAAIAAMILAVSKPCVGQPRAEAVKPSIRIVSPEGKPKPGDVSSKPAPLERTPFDSVTLGQEFLIEVKVPDSWLPGDTLNVKLTTAAGDERILTLTGQDTQNGLTTFRTVMPVSIAGERGRYIYDGTIEQLTLTNGERVTVELTGFRGPDAQLTTKLGVYDSTIQQGIGRNSQVLDWLGERLPRQTQFADGLLARSDLPSDVRAEVEGLKAEAQIKEQWLAEARGALARASTDKGKLIAGRNYVRLLMTPLSGPSAQAGANSAADLLESVQEQNRLAMNAILTDAYVNTALVVTLAMYDLVGGLSMAAPAYAVAQALINKIATAEKWWLGLDLSSIDTSSVRDHFGQQMSPDDQAAAVGELLLAYLAIRGLPKLTDWLAGGADLPVRSTGDALSARGVPGSARASSPRGLPQQEIDYWVNRARAANPAFADANERGIRQDLLPALEDAVRSARAKGVGDAQIDAVLARARTARPNDVEVSNRVIRELLVEEANTRGARILVDPTDVRWFEDFAGGARPNATEIRDLSILAEIRTKGTFEAKGKRQLWTAEEARTVREDILPQGDAAMDWYGFEPEVESGGLVGGGFVPAFDAESLGNIRGVFGPGAARAPQIAPESTPGAGAARPAPKVRRFFLREPELPAADAGPPPDAAVRGGDTAAGNLRRQVAAPGTPGVDDPYATRPPPGGTRGDPGQTRIDPDQTRIEPPRPQADPNQTRVDPGQTRIDPPQARPDANQTRIDPGQTRLEPPQAQPDPNQTRMDPGQTRLDPPQARVDPSQTSVDAGQTRIDPGQTRIDPGLRVLIDSAAPPAASTAPASSSPVAPGTSPPATDRVPLPPFTSGTSAPRGSSTTGGPMPPGSVVAPDADRERAGPIFVLVPGGRTVPGGSGAAPDSYVAFNVTPGLSFFVDSTRSRWKPFNGWTLSRFGATSVMKGATLPFVQFVTTTTNGTRVRAPAAKAATDKQGRVDDALPRLFWTQSFVAAMSSVWATAVSRLSMPSIDPRSRTTRWRSSQQESNGEPPAPPIKMFLKSLGRSTGEAFEMIVVNEDPVDIELAAEGLVLEPVAGVTAQTLDREIAQQTRAGTVTTTLTAYCLELLKDPPSAGMVFRLADRATQQRFASYRSVLEASRLLRDAGRLIPDGGDATTYFDSIRQWAIWTKEQDFDQKRFADALAEHTRKNVVAAGQRWNKEIEQAVRKIAPGRWRAIQLVLQEASRAGLARP